MKLHDKEEEEEDEVHTHFAVGASSLKLSYLVFHLAKLAGRQEMKWICYLHPIYLPM